MQGVGIVLHADLPWTPARLEQRVGRVVREGSGAREVLETWFAAPSGARALVRLGARLARKTRLRRRAVREGGARGEVVGILEEWLAAGMTPDASEHRRLRPRRGATAAMRAAVDGFISVAHGPAGAGTGTGARAELVCGVHDGARWRVSSAPRRVLSVLRAADVGDRPHAASVPPEQGRGENGHSSAITARRARRLFARVLARRLALAVTGTAPDGVPRARRLERVRRRLARLLERAPALARPVLAKRHGELLRILARPLEAAREARIDDLLRLDLDDAAFARRLGRSLEDRMDGATTGGPSEPARHAARGAARDAARAAPLLLLRRASAPPGAPADAPPTASPGSAATR